ncbi:hypothetical protein [Kitasatospora sp. Root187]|uniref:hypothetical protein n=1 Tax=Kitasatospora sp. Root187 TaxID=1736486 RepID=UPI0012F860AA|nr:hypothetical protein [Kitasatospora sp. Root187]
MNWFLLGSGRGYQRALSRYAAHQDAIKRALAEANEPGQKPPAPPAATGQPRRSGPTR